MENSRIANVASSELDRHAIALAELRYMMEDVENKLFLFRTILKNEPTLAKEFISKIMGPIGEIRQIYDPHGKVVRVDRDRLKPVKAA